ncbi:uncharacterized protein LOC133243951 [Bos javanicus]|uniref:uncharacterized protein LOC133243951 n=1 Tax=Bos javanicus TaxID=9906 RepID=UPI002AA7C21D|nr:uncharacterized protein LOC133243951 [Bos javanicus]
MRGKEMEAASREGTGRDKTEQSPGGPAVQVAHSQGGAALPLSRPLLTDPTWAGLRTSGSLWQTSQQTTQEIGQCCDAPRKASWECCRMSRQRQRCCGPLPVPGGHLVRHLPPHTVVLRLIEEEKENTEQWAEETESREGRGSLGSLRRFKSVSSLNLLPTSSHAGSCLPLPKPRRRWHSLAQEGDQLGIMTLGDTRSSLSEDQGVLYGNHCERMTLELRLPALWEEVGDDKTAIKCETSTPASLRSLWLDRLHTGVLHTAHPRGPQRCPQVSGLCVRHQFQEPCASCLEGVARMILKEYPWV